MENRAKRILLVGSALWYLGAGMVGPLFALYTQQVGGDLLEIVWAWAIYLFVLGGLMIVVGRRSDRGDKARIMLVGYALNAAFTFSYLLVSTPVHLFLVQAGLGLAAALATPTWDALYTEHQDRKKDGEEWGMADGMPHIVTGFAVLMSGLVIELLSFSALFAVMGTISAFAALYQARILWE